jgi:hypothetical protein
MGQECNEVIAQSQDLRDGDGTWEIHDSEIMMDFGGSLMWAHPTGFLSFRGIEFMCDIDHSGSYGLDRAE